jgi:acyl carrier protein
MIEQRLSANTTIGGAVNQRDIEDLIIELLAEAEGSDPAEMRQRIEEAGDNLPFDSVLVAEVVFRVEERCGVQMPTSEQVARCLGSVRDFAAVICDLMESSRVRRVGGGA